MFLLLMSMFGGHAAALERGASKAGPMLALPMAGAEPCEATQESSHTTVSSLPGAFVSEPSKVRGPCKGDNDCQYLVPLVSFSSGKLVVDHGPQAAADKRPRHIWKLLRPPIG